MVASPTYNPNVLVFDVLGITLIKMLFFFLNSTLIMHV